MCRAIVNVNELVRVTYKGLDATEPSPMDVAEIFGDVQGQMVAPPDKPIELQDMTLSMPNDVPFSAELERLGQEPIKIRDVSSSHPSDDA